MALSITKGQLFETIDNRPRLKRVLKEHPFTEDSDVSQRDVKQNLAPGTVGITQTKSGNYMAYCMEEAGKLSKTSVHLTKEEAYGMVLRRYLDYAGMKRVKIAERNTLSENSGCSDGLPEHLFWTSEGKNGGFDFELSIRSSDIICPEGELPNAKVEAVLRRYCGDVERVSVSQDNGWTRICFSSEQTPYIQPILPGIMNCFSERLTFSDQDLQFEASGLELSNADLQFNEGPFL